jgi:hypothetical protein
MVQHRRDRRTDPHVYLRVTTIKGNLVKDNLFGATDIVTENRRYTIKNLLAMVYMPQTPIGRQHGTRVKLRNPAFPASLDNIYIEHYKDPIPKDQSFLNIASISKVKRERAANIAAAHDSAQDAAHDIESSIEQTVEDMLLKENRSKMIMCVPGVDGRYFIDKYGNMYDRKARKRIRFDQCPRTSKLRTWISFPGSGNSFWAYYSNIVALTIKLNGEWLPASKVMIKGPVEQAISSSPAAKEWNDRPLPGHLLKDPYLTRHANGDIWDFTYTNIEFAIPEQMIDYNQDTAISSKDILFSRPNIEKFSRDVKYEELKAKFSIFTPPKVIKFSKTSGLVADRKKVLLSYVQVQAAVVAYHDFGTDIEHIAKGLFQTETEQELLWNKEMLQWLLVDCMPRQRYSSKSRWSRSLRYCLERIAEHCPA